VKKLRRRAPWLALAASAVGLSLVSAQASSASGSSSGGVISMGIEPWIGYAPWYIAQKEGYFAKYGLKVNIVNFQQDADRNSALIADRTNVSNIDTGRTIQFASKKLPAVPLLLVDDSNGADAIMSTKSVSKASQIKGQSIAYEFGTTSDLLLHYYLLQHHMSFNSIQSVNVPAADAGTLLIAGKDKVVVTYQPYISEATSHNGANVHVFFSSKQAPGLISDFLVANKSWLTSHGQQARELIKAWNDSITYYHAHTKQAVAIMAAGIGATPASLSSVLPGVILYSVAQDQAMVKSGQLAKEYMSIGKTLTAMKQIPHAVSLSSVANFSYLK
jgi:NitT/TauT family transport system substrate-binding protein